MSSWPGGSSLPSLAKWVLLGCKSIKINVDASFFVENGTRSLGNCGSWLHAARLFLIMIGFFFLYLSQFEGSEASCGYYRFIHCYFYAPANHVGDRLVMPWPLGMDKENELSPATIG